MTAIIIAIFVIGYTAIAAEHYIGINKAATALITGVLSWTVYIIFSVDKELISEQLTMHLGELSGILFFLMGAMAIVEIIDAHHGFDIITNRIVETNKRKLLWIVATITFFLSPLLDNLTTTIVVISLLRKLIKDPEERLLYAGMVIVASNAGGAWSPIGDVTTTMLWIGGQITASSIVLNLFIPAVFCLLVPLTVVTLRLKGNVERPASEAGNSFRIPSKKHQILVFTAGVLTLLFVPVFKSITHLPPYMGILIGLGVLWVITELIHGDKDQEDKHVLSVAYALQKVDTPSILFFLGILVSIAALQSVGVLTVLSERIYQQFSNENLIVIIMGLASSVIDNVPLVAASQAMYDLSRYPVDHSFWQFLAYCTGTGGSILIIGSAAGVAAMGIEKISFTWYLKNISLLALLGYMAGAGAYLLQHFLVYKSF